MATKGQNSPRIPNEIPNETRYTHQLKLDPEDLKKPLNNMDLMPTSCERQNNGRFWKTPDTPLEYVFDWIQGNPSKLWLKKKSWNLFGSVRSSRDLWRR